MKAICIDTGVLSIYFSTNKTAAVKSLMNDILGGKYRVAILKPVLVEEFFQICKDSGLQEANTQILNFMRNFPIDFVDLDESLILNAGKLKCQHASTLSYIDCMSIAFCLKQGAELHTTEKLLKQIPHNVLDRLRTVKYDFVYP
jgi:predicted nucleic acid-binding protein